MALTPASSTIPSERIEELDALRGLAVIGIAWMNVHAFALPFQAYYNPAVWGGDGLLDRFVWIASFVFVEDKFRTLFAMLFGAGMVMLLARDRQRDAMRPWRAHYARMVVLFAIGMAHSILLASNDVLRAYALAGLALPLLAPLTARALYAIAIGLLVIHVAAGMSMFGAAVVDFYAGRTASDAALFARRNFGDDPAALAYALDLGREGLGERIIRRSANIAGQWTVVAGSLPLNLAGVSLGMALWKDRLFAGEWRTFRLQRIAAIAGLFAVPALFALAWWVVAEGFPASVVAAAGLVLSAPFDTALALAYAALAMALFERGGAVTRKLAAVGRLSLTNYVMTSAVFAGLFASWGLGLFGEVGRAQAFAFSFVPVAAMLAFSPPWIARIGQGPFERAWRWASRRLG